jgi:CTP:molybdopterin cytidylyltransferase MocA
VSAGIILAAGASTRFGGSGPKLLAPFRGRPLVAWALEHADGGGLDEIILVVGAVDLSALVSSQITVENPRWRSGLATSLQVGVAEAERRGHRSVVVGLGDQPLVPASAWRAVGASASPIAVASFAGHRSPPVRLAHDVWPLLPTTGDAGARELMRARPDLVTDVPCDGHALDIDTTEDLAAWD